MTMDVEATIDPEIAVALAASPMGAIDFGTFTFEAMPAMREAMANMPAVELPPTTTESHEVVVPGATGFDPDRARLRTAHEGRGSSVHLLDPRWRLHVRLRPQRRRPHQPLGRGVRLRRGVDRVPPRPRGPVPRAARRLLRGPAVGRAARRRAGRRSEAHRRRRCQRGSRSRRRPRDPGARPRRGVARVPVAHLSDDRRQQHERVEPDRGRAGVEPRGQRPGVAGLPR